MAGWEISRHPEWDLMYIAGLTAREISDLCGWSLSTVHFHLRQREKYQPGIQSKHVVALIARHPDRPRPRWRKQMTLIKEFTATSGRLPEASAEPDERRLHTWLVSQRRSYRGGEMSPGKKYLLDSLGDWQSTTRKEVLERHWLERLQMVADFYSQTGRFPRYRSYTTELEHTLGVWLHIQHQSRSQKKLSIDRHQKIDAALPGWKSSQ